MEFKTPARREAERTSKRPLH
ncbi:hypothetical protein PLUA15_190022 [Pseudomonas lundensis]|uniref:Uncharacterized protein n=1 Tax=Pseudomonas lundensis TaxID=86185 RepID=A0AAX2H5H5_9PSED|nr:hypothetical protein PLUA15_190022 [Pseudomonas lundensis]